VSPPEALFTISTDDHWKFSVVLEFSGSIHVDSASLLVLSHTVRSMHEKGCKVVLCGLQSNHMMKFERAGLIKLIGPANIVLDVPTAILILKGEKNESHVI
jgi:anti-anti-sigma regulatory factor